MRPEDAARLGGMRPGLLDLRVRILRRLSEAALTRSTAGLEEDCFTTLGDALTYEEAQFLLSMDAFYEGLYGIKDFAWSPMRSMAFHNSGLTDLFEIIGHFEKEIAVGTMRKTAMDLQTALGDTSVSSYYEIIPLSKRACVDAALEDFLRLEEAERDFLDDYRTRISCALETRFGENVTVSLKVRRGQAQQFTPMLRTFADFVKAYVDATGQFPNLSLSSPETTSTPLGNVFRCSGATWTVTFNGVTKHFNDTKGMRYVHFLIQHRSREFHVLELARDVDGLPLPDVTHSQMRTEEEGIPFASRTSQRELMDDDYEAAVQEKVKELQEKRDLAETMGDEDAVSAAQDELEQYLSSLASGIGRGGRHREFTDEGERARQRISKAIHSALRTIQDELPELYAHLKSSMLPLGHTVRYKPTTPIDWTL